MHPLALPLGELAADRLTERVPQRRKYHLNMLRVALSVCPLRGSQLPQRGSQVARRFRYAKLQFTDLLFKSILYFRKYTKIIPIWQPICEKYLPNHYTWGYNSAKPYKAGIFHDCCD